MANIQTSLDAVGIGRGHHGLVAAVTLVDAGCDVCLLEAADRGVDLLDTTTN